MAVQKSKVTPARRGMRRSHDSLKAAALTEDVTTGEIHRRHHFADASIFFKRDSRQARLTKGIRD
jgi:large subunit ribosomal protein L32